MSNLRGIKATLNHGIRNLETESRKIYFILYNFFQTNRLEPSFSDSVFRFRDFVSLLRIPCVS